MDELITEFEPVVRDIDDTNSVSQYCWSFIFMNDGDRNLEPDTTYKITINGNEYLSTTCVGSVSGVTTSRYIIAYLPLTISDGLTACVRQLNYSTKYDVYYSDDPGKEEVKYQHGSVYTKPKVKPEQWRTKTTTAGVTTYGPWKLLSAETPTGTEGTDYEYMLETYVVREVWEANRALNVLLPKAASTDTEFSIDIRKMAECTDQIHGDVISHFEAPEILENLNAYKHKDNENYTHSGSAGVVKTRRVKRGASNKPEYTTISKKANWSAATNYISATSAQLGQPIEFYVGNGHNDSSGYCPKFEGNYTSTMGGTTIPSTAFTALGELKDNKYTYKVTLANVTGPIVISGQTQGDGNEAVPEKK